MPREEFTRIELEQLLVECHRRCCVCHKYCGVKIEVDHIISATTAGSSDIGNAIPVCFECHAEIHYYNPKHPKGRRFQEAELRSHRDQWLAICRDHPEIFVHSQPRPEAGSLERLLAELEFNLAVAKAGRVSGPFLVIQFQRAIADGTFSWISENLKNAITGAYVAINEANFRIDGMVSGGEGSRWAKTAPAAVMGSVGPIQSAIDVLNDAMLADSA
jgi:hypothetical protein